MGRILREQTGDRAADEPQEDMIERYRKVLY